jgi:hypothetical protein
MLTFQTEGKYPCTLVIRKFGKEYDLGRKNAQDDRAMVAQLDMLKCDPDQRPNKRQKVAHESRFDI